LDHSLGIISVTVGSAVSCTQQKGRIRAQLNARSRVLEKLTVTQLVKKFHASFWKLKVYLLLCSQEPATGPFSEPHEFSQLPTAFILRSILHRSLQSGVFY